MNLGNCENKMRLEILQAEKNPTVKSLMLAGDKLQGEAKAMFKAAVAIAYDKGLQDGYKPKTTSTRI